MDLQRQGLRAALDPDWRGGRTARVLEGALLGLPPNRHPAGVPVRFAAEALQEKIGQRADLPGYR